MKSEHEFRLRAADEGFGAVEEKRWVPGPVKALHTHDTSVLLLVTAGELAIEYEDDTRIYGPGDVLSLPAKTPHTERPGKDGAESLIAFRSV